MPNLSWRQFSLAIADLWLTSEGSEEWVKVPQIRRVWHLILMSTFALALLMYPVAFLFEEQLKISDSWTLVFRLLRAGGLVWLLILESILAALYYRFLLSTERDLRFSNILVFWATWVVLFTALYSSLYNLNPALYSNSIIGYVPSKTLHSLGLRATLKTTIIFLLYSACVTVSHSIPGLTSASLIVSALNLVETLGSLLFLVLVVATFVNKATLAKKKSKS